MTGSLKTKGSELFRWQETGQASTSQLHTSGPVWVRRPSLPEANNGAFHVSQQGNSDVPVSLIISLHWVLLKNQYITLFHIKETMDYGNKTCLERSSYYHTLWNARKNITNTPFKCIVDFTKSKENTPQGQRQGILHLSGKLAFRVELSSAFANLSF